MKLRWLILPAVLVPILAVNIVSAQLRPGTGTGGGVTGWPSSAITKIVTWANSFANALGIGDGNDYIAIYRDPTTGLQINPVCGGVESGCNFIRKLLSTFYWEIQNASGTPIFRVSESGGITYATLNTEATGNTITIQEEDWWDVASCQNGTAQLVWNVPTSNAPAAACDPDSTPEAYASFDASTDESFTKSWVLPTGFTGAIDVHLIWKAAATTGSAGWCAQLVRIPDGTTSGQSVPAQSSSNCVSDPAKGTTLQENHATITGVTCSSCAARDRVKLVVSRDANGSAVTDDMAGDGHLMKVGRTWRVAK